MSEITTKAWNEAITREFSWLEALLPCGLDRLTARMKVGRVDEKLLALAPHEEEGTAASEYSTRDLILLIDRNSGKAVAQVAAGRTDYGDGTNTDGETIGDAFARLPSPQIIEWVLRYESEHPGVVNPTEPTREVTVYRVAGFDIRAYLNERADAANRAVAAALVSERVASQR